MKFQAIAVACLAAAPAFAADTATLGKLLRSSTLARFETENGLKTMLLAKIEYAGAVENCGRLESGDRYGTVSYAYKLSYRKPGPNAAPRQIEAAVVGHHPDCAFGEASIEDDIQVKESR